jgi:hypothetical protein
MADEKLQLESHRAAVREHIVKSKTQTGRGEPEFALRPFAMFRLKLRKS